MNQILQRVYILALYLYDRTKWTIGNNSNPPKTSPKRYKCTTIPPKVGLVIHALIIQRDL